MNCNRDLCFTMNRADQSADNRGFNRAQGATAEETFDTGGHNIDSE